MGGEIEQHLELLGCAGSPTEVRWLRTGASGAEVVLLELDDRAVVLKVTADRRWRGRAERELALYREHAAGQLGVATPTALAAQQDRAAVRLLLSYADPYPPGGELTTQQWLDLAAALARLHRDRPALPAWAERARWPTAPEVAVAVERWAAYGQGDLARSAVDHLDEAREHLEDLPSVLVHGDCHVGNLLRAGAETQWIDWQEVGLGGGPEDLALLWQRAEFEGASPPREEMLEAYGAALADWDEAAFRCGLWGVEVRLLLLGWSHHLTRGSAEQRQRLADRLRELIEGGAG